MPKKLYKLYAPQRTGLILLGLWLLALLLVTGYTVKLLWDEDQLQTKSLEQKQINAMKLLAQQIEEVLRNELNNPIQLLKNMSIKNIRANEIANLNMSSPLLKLILLFDENMRIINTVYNNEPDELRCMLNGRIQMEHLNSHLKIFGMHTFVEPLDGKFTMFVLKPLINISSTPGWILLGFDLQKLLESTVNPMLKTVELQENGNITLIGPYDNWIDAAINISLHTILPGYFLSFQPNQSEQYSLFTFKALPISLSLLVLLALGLASWSAFSEVRRSHSVADLRQRFVANVSHELKTPLALIRMYAETLCLGRISDPERIITYHKVILREAERLSGMIQNVLAFARLNYADGACYLRQTDLFQTVSDIVEDIRPNIEKDGLYLHSQLDNNIPPLPHEREGIARILWNLLDNAVKYAGSKKIEVRLYSIDSWVRLEVIDQGLGIPQVERMRLLRPFERGGETVTVTGSGLGLALVKQIAEVHGAIFSLEKSVGGGLCARVAFSVKKDQLIKSD